MKFEIFKVNLRTDMMEPHYSIFKMTLLSFWVIFMIIFNKYLLYYLLYYYMYNNERCILILKTSNHFPFLYSYFNLPILLLPPHFLSTLTYPILCPFSLVLVTPDLSNPNS